MSTILIVDDDADIRGMLEMVFAQEGYGVVTASNGEVALERLTEMGKASQKPCVILLDLMMPVMDGFEFLGRVRADPALRPLDVVVLSALDQLMAKLPEGVERLRKPVDVEELLRQVEVHCGRAA